MKLISKLSLGLIAFCASTALSTEGLYAGVGIGMSNLQANKSKDSHENISYFSNSGSNGTVTGAFLGYNHLLVGSPLFIGLEGSVHAHNLKTHLNQSHNGDALEKVSAKIDHSFSGVFKFGVVINELMIYAKAGVNKSAVRLHYFSDCHGADAFDKIIKTNVYGSAYGFGVDFRINPNWGIGIDHTVNSYSNIDIILPNGTARVDPVVSTTALRLTYTF